jgi:hypothetical protein
MPAVVSPEDRLSDAEGVQDGRREIVVVPDPRVLEHVRLVEGDHCLLPVLAGEGSDRVDVLSERV